jgi:hypothetical protein
MIRTKAPEWAEETEHPDPGVEEYYARGGSVTPVGDHEITNVGLVQRNDGPAQVLAYGIRMAPAEAPQLAKLLTDSAHQIRGSG